MIASLTLLVSACHGAPEQAKPPTVAAAAVGYDANDDFKAAGTTGEQTLRGSFAPEGTAGVRSAWIGRSANLQLNAPVEGRGLLVSGWAPYSLHQKSGLQGPLEVTVRVNGVQVATRSFTADEQFDLKVTNAELVKAGGDGKNSTVEIVVSHSFVPSQALGGNDSRELSIMVKKVLLIS
jgi:hypothetical protein